jgi:hypothetical protein
MPTPAHIRTPAAEMPFSCLVTTLHLPSESKFCESLQPRQEQDTSELEVLSVFFGWKPKAILARSGQSAELNTILGLGKA